MISYLEYLNASAKVGCVVIACFAAMQIIGEVLEFKGKVVPEFMKIRKFFSRRKTERKEQRLTLQRVEQQLKEVNAHYSSDNIARRDNWIQWVNDRSAVYDKSIVEINKNLLEVTQALKDNTNLTEEMFVQSSRDRIIDFAAKVADESVMVSREEFNRIFKVYDRYEKYIKDRGLTNGEVDVSIQIIRESYEAHMKNHTFIEDVRGYQQTKDSDGGDV